MRKLNRSGLMAVGFLLLLYISPPSVAVPVQLDPCTPIDPYLLSSVALQKKFDENKINHICFSKKPKDPLKNGITITVKDFLKVDGLNLIADPTATPFPLLSLTGTGTVEFDNLQLTNAFTGIEVASGITVKFTNSAITCGADPNSTGIRILSTVQNASIQDAAITGCKIGIDDMGTGTSVVGGSLTNGVVGIVANGSQGKVNAIEMSGFQTGIQLKGSAHTVTNVMISNATIGIDDIGTNASIFGGSITGSNGLIGIRSIDSGITIDEGLAIKGFKEGIHLEGSNHLVAGIAVVCDEIANSIAITAKGTQIVLGPDITADACTTGILMDGQQITATMNNLNKITPSESRIVHTPGTNNNIPKIPLSIDPKNQNLWAIYGKDKMIIKLIGLAPSGTGIVEAFVYKEDYSFETKFKCDVLLKSKRPYSFLAENADPVFECTQLAITNDEKNKPLVWVTYTNEDGTSSSSKATLLPEPASVPIIPGQTPTETTFATDPGSSDVFGDPSLEPGDSDDKKGNPMSATEGGLSVGGSGSGGFKTGCSLNRYPSTSGIPFGLLILGIGTITLLLLPRRGCPFKNRLKGRDDLP